MYGIQPQDAQWRIGMKTVCLNILYVHISMSVHTNYIRLSRNHKSSLFFSKSHLHVNTRYGQEYGTL